MKTFSLVLAFAWCNSFSKILSRSRYIVYEKYFKWPPFWNVYIDFAHYYLDRYFAPLNLLLDFVKIDQKHLYAITFKRSHTHTNEPFSYRYR